MTQRIVASIQARMGSERLPGKVLIPVLGKPFLQWQIERVVQSRLIDDIVVATTTNRRDDAIVEFCETRGYSYFRGDENDVLNRLANLVNEFKADIHVELFGDSPLSDHQIIDEFLGYALKHSESLDVITNTLQTTYPPGFELLVYRAEALLKLNRLVPDRDKLREHCGYNFVRFPEVFRIENLVAPSKFHALDYYFELDTLDDLSVLTEFFEQLDSHRILEFGLYDILSFAKGNDALFAGNRNVHRRWRDFRF